MVSGSPPEGTPPRGVTTQKEAGWGAGRAAWSGCAQEVEGAADVDAGVPRRVLDRLAHVDLCREVEDDVRLPDGEDLAQPVGVADVDLVELDPAPARRVEVLRPARGRVSEEDAVAAAIQEGVDEIRADEAGSAG